MSTEADRPERTITRIDRFTWNRPPTAGSLQPEVFLFDATHEVPFADVAFYAFTGGSNDPVPKQDESGVHLVYREELRACLWALLTLPVERRVSTRQGERFGATITTPWIDRAGSISGSDPESLLTRPTACPQEGAHPDGILVKAHKVVCHMRSPSHPDNADYVEIPAVGMMSEGPKEHVHMGFLTHERRLRPPCPPRFRRRASVDLGHIDIELSVDRYPTVLHAAFQPDFRVRYTSTEQHQAARLTYGSSDDWVLEVGGSAIPSCVTCVERELRVTR